MITFREYRKLQRVVQNSEKENRRTQEAGFSDKVNRRTQEAGFSDKRIEY